MKIALIADIHLKLWNDDKYDDIGIPLRLREILNSVESVCQYCSEYNIDHIGILGDINDTKSVASTRAFALFKNILEKYSKITFHILHGNHDITGKYSKESSIDLLAGYKNVITITTPLLYGNVLWVPYGRNMTEYLNQCDSADILFTHMGLSDATLSSGISLRVPFSSQDLNKFKISFSGHYHKPQTVGNYHYVGSVIPLRRDEHGESKRFIILDTDTLKWESQPLTGFREYFEFILTENNEGEVKEIFEKVKELKSNGHYITVKNELKKFEKQDLAELSGVNLINSYNKDIKQRGINNSMDIKTQMLKYLEHEKVTSAYIDKYINIGLNAITIK